MTIEHVLWSCRDAQLLRLLEISCDHLIPSSVGCHLQVKRRLQDLQQRGVPAVMLKLAFRIESSATQPTTMITDSENHPPQNEYGTYIEVICLTNHMRGSAC